MEHTYYVAAHRRVYGTRTSDREVAAMLYAAYMANLAYREPGRYDGASLVGERRMIIVVHHDGRGSDGKVIETETR